MTGFLLGSLITIWPWKSDEKIIRRYNSGIELQISINLCKNKSVLPAKYPWIAPKKIPIVDPKYRSQIIPKLINSIMYDGKKTTAEKIVYDAIDKIKTKVKQIISRANVYKSLSQRFNTKPLDKRSKQAASTNQP